MINETTIESPLGPLRLRATEVAMVGIYFSEHKGAPSPQDSLSENSVLQMARQQLNEYFHGTLQDFELPLDAPGTEFQRRVWAALTAIPFGETTNYGELARRLECPGGARAVGRANALNPLSIVVPCHRVIGASGQLTGYAGGINTKKWLLRHETSTSVPG